jgi:O-antigen ligase
MIRILGSKNLFFQLRRLFIVFCFAGFGIISFLPDLLGFPAQNTTIAFRAIMAGISLILILVFIPNLKTSVKVTSILSILLIIAYCLRLANDSDLDFGRNFYEIMLLAIGTAFLPAIALFTIKDSRLIIRTFDLLIISYLIICSMAFLSGDFYLNSKRLAGNSILNPITLGHFAASGIILVIVKFSSTRNLNYANRNLFWSFVCLIVFSSVLVMASSRGPVVSLILTLAYFIIPKTRLINLKNLVSALTFIVVMSSILLASSGLIDNFSNRMVVNLGDDQSLGEARVFLWAEGIKIFLENPIFGKQTTTSMGYPHNIIIEMLMALGIIGTAVFFYIVLKCLKKINRLREMDSLLVWPGLLFIQYLIGSFFSGTIYSNNMLWYCTALVLTINLNHLRNIPRTI